MAPKEQEPKAKLVGLHQTNSLVGWHQTEVSSQQREKQNEMATYAMEENVCKPYI